MSVAGGQPSDRQAGRNNGITRADGVDPGPPLSVLKHPGLDAVDIHRPCQRFLAQFLDPSAALQIGAEAEGHGASSSQGFTSTAPGVDI